MLCASLSLADVSNLLFRVLHRRYSPILKLPHIAVHRHYVKSLNLDPFMNRKVGGRICHVHHHRPAPRPLAPVRDPAWNKD